MVTEPPRDTDPLPPQVADRRAPERRAYARRSEDRTRLIRLAVQAALMVCLGLAIIFLAFAAIGAVNFGNAIVATLIALGLALIWLVGYFYRRRHEELGSVRLERERRGF